MVCVTGARNSVRMYGQDGVGAAVVWASGSEHAVIVGRRGIHMPRRMMARNIAACAGYDTGTLSRRQSDPFRKRPNVLASATLEASFSFLLFPVGSSSPLPSTFTTKNGFILTDSSFGIRASSSDYFSFNTGLGARYRSFQSLKYETWNSSEHPGVREMSVNGLSRRMLQFDLAESVIELYPSSLITLP
ncbi:hypothetical protein GYMLUDRAFT_260342 [Collybiopsis luxurians FD-317 M1]|uniref:Uncharacterized protein n=1 Tax=Collybiopsis luxurians FD-317 M1 TaxID=944289 RepID=A0A0D0CHJ6_9AGAR|nr:hypothetical protein GYMLUDRAFT_260342 [Collybiopsis luxurians FD-317 M1]